jgi:hypothetical protein
MPPPIRFVSEKSPTNSALMVSPGSAEMEAGFSGTPSLSKLNPTWDADRLRLVVRNRKALNPKYFILSHHPDYMG